MTENLLPQCGQIFCPFIKGSKERCYIVSSIEHQIKTFGIRTARVTLSGSGYIKKIEEDMNSGIIQCKDPEAAQAAIARIKNS